MAYGAPFPENDDSSKLKTAALPPSQTPNGSKQLSLPASLSLVGRFQSEFLECVLGLPSFRPHHSDTIAWSLFIGTRRASRRISTVGASRSLRRMVLALQDLRAAPRSV